MENSEQFLYGNIRNNFHRKKFCVNFQIIDEAGNRLGPNERGQICFRTPTIFNGYYDDPGATKLAYDPEGWGYTGDIGYFDDEKNIFVVDRIKNMMKFNHLIITPSEIESVINEIEGVIGSCVVGVFDAGNDIITAFVVKAENSNLSEEFVENFVNSRVIDNKKIRGGVHFLEKFPLTSTEKIKTRELKEIAEKIYRTRKNV